MKLYMMGVTRYYDIARAEYVFNRLNSPAALESHKCGGATVVFLKSCPVQPGQVAYVGSTHVQFNSAAQALLNRREG